MWPGKLVAGNTESRCHAVCSMVSWPVYGGEAAPLTSVQARTTGSLACVNTVDFQLMAFIA